jgi:hypothetical protein
MKYDESYLKAIIVAYQPDFPEPLTLAEAEEIADNTIRLFKYLDFLSHKYANKLTKSA